MMNQNDQKRVLALDVRSQSFGFAVFEGSSRLLDWGVRSFRSGVNAVKHPASQKLFVLLDEFNPSAIVTREARPERKNTRASLFATMQRVATSRKIPVRFVSRETMQRAFRVASRTRYRIACSAAERLPELASRLPPKRKIWQSEDYRMSIFDAAALGIAYFARCGKYSSALSGDNLT
jgi:hypothetical protein